ncbi:MAG: D-alanyl-D-alanine carboxypeptidase family protein [Syntrophomonadaceae bacterium]|jgi:D-alanyl-D-alanine carboxypeptidase (penicillin-binding protein 5/6)
MIKTKNKIIAGLILSLVLSLIYSPALLALPYINSNYFCVVDASSGQIIFSSQADEMRPVASTTKMMTAILAMEYANPEEIALVSLHAQKTPEYAIGLREGQDIPISELLKVALIRSANDAAVVLAEHVAGEERFFAHLMSKKAFVLGAFKTHFCNASGLPSADHYSTAFDLTRIGCYLLKNEYLKKIVASRHTEFQHPGYSQPITIYNTNSLLGTFPGADGIKTGTTNAAGKCLIASATREGRQLVAVTLRSGNRRKDCATLLEYGFNNSSLVKIIDSSQPFKQVKVVDGVSSYIDLYPAHDIFVWVAESSPDIQKKVNVIYKVNAPVNAGQKLGTVSVYADNKLVQSTDLVCRQKINSKLTGIRKIINKVRCY